MLRKFSIASRYIIFSLVFLTSCHHRGDFGHKQSNFFNNYIAPTYHFGPHHGFLLSVDEKNLRSLSYNFSHKKYSDPDRTAHDLLYALQNDIYFVDKFTKIARRVIAVDAKRRRRLADFQDISYQPSSSVRSLVRENREIIRSTITAMRNRTNDYRLDIKRQKLKHPGPPENKIALAIDRLDFCLHRLDRLAL